MVTFKQSRNKYGDYIITGKNEEYTYQIVIHKETEAPYIDSSRRWWSSDLWGRYSTLRDAKYAAKEQIKKRIEV